MTKKTKTCAIAAFLLVAAPANAEDDPNAAIAADTARINAEAARINAEAALTTAKAAKDKGAIEALGLPKFENKTELVEKGGAIETAMLASRAVSAAGGSIAGLMQSKCTSQGSPIVVLAGNEAFDINSAQTMQTRIGYHTEILQLALLRKGSAGGVNWLNLPMITGLASAAVGLFGNETKVSGVDLPEIDDSMLANVVAGQLTQCAILPSAGGGIANFKESKIAESLTTLVNLRNSAARQLASIPEKPNAAQKAQGAQLKEAIADFDAFYKTINTPDAEGKTPLIRAVLVERVTSKQNPMLLRVTINRSGGTITNSKNIKTFFGADPVRVSGGLVASYALVDANSGAVLAAGTTACQTAQAKLRNVQSGDWYTYDANGNAKAKAEAFCH